MIPLSFEYIHTYVYTLQNIHVLRLFKCIGFFNYNICYIHWFNFFFQSHWRNIFFCLAKHITNLKYQKLTRKHMIKNYYPIQIYRKIKNIFKKCQFWHTNPKTTRNKSKGSKVPIGIPFVTGFFLFDQHTDFNEISNFGWT